MSYAVDWAPAARRQLAAIWMQAVHQRSAVAAAQARIDQLLAADPLRYGTPLSEGLYVIEVPPLRAVFEVSDTGQFITVDAVHCLP